MSKKKDAEKSDCEICLSGMTEFYNVVKDNKTEASIVAAIEKFCYLFPEKIAFKCEALLKFNTKEIKKMIVDDLTPKDVCISLNFCDSKKDSETLKHADDYLLAGGRNKNNKK